MKILYAKFINFKGIYNGTGRTELELDFSKSKNKIILLSGKNGSGKSTILSLLHPFAGTLDSRSNFIIKDTVGYKEIIIQDGKDEYLIKHHYDMTKARPTTKSYIAKKTLVGDWEELNETGTVKSFEGLIKDLLDVDTSFFTLSRIGSNVEGFIDKSPTERKKYISNFLPSIDEYLVLYKRVSDQWTDLKKRISRVVEAIGKLDSIDHILATLENLNNRLDFLTQEERELQTIISRAEGFIDAKDPKGELMNEYNNVLKEFKTANDEYKLTVADIQSSRYKSKAEALEDEKKYSSASAKAEKKIIRLESELRAELNTQTSILEAIEKVEDSLSTIKDSTSVAEYKEIIKQRTKDLQEAESDLESLSHLADMNITNQNIPRFETAMENLVDYADSVQDGYQLSEIEGMAKETRTVKEIAEEIETLKGELKTADTKIGKAEDEVKFYKSKADLSGILDQKPEDCVNYSCAFIAEAVKYKDAPEKEALAYSDVDKYKRIKVKKKAKLEALERLYKLASTISTILKSYKRHKDDIVELKPDFTMETRSDVVDFILSDKSNLASTSDMRQYIIVQSIIASCSDEIKRSNQMIKQLSSQEKLLKKLESELSDNREKLEGVAETVKELRTELDSNKKKQNQYDLRLNEIDEIVPLFDKINNLKTTIKDTKLKYNDMKFTIDDIKIKKEEADTAEERLDEILADKKPLISEIDKLKLNIERLKEYNADKALLEEKLQNVTNIREALSPTKGIPLLFIDVYLKQTKIIANELIDIAYGGKFDIDKFDINEKEFRIRMNKEDAYIDEDNDITDCSQGERALTSVCLSMALIQQSLKRYNILCLDEIDSELDSDNRRAFLSIMETLMEKLGIEQTFIISHNKEFDTHPIDLIIMPGSDIDVEDKEFMKNKNIIFTA